MCGIAGFWQMEGFAPDQAAATVERMASRLTHRGPDDAGVWVDADAGVALAHRRLAILDLTPAGHQPMVSHSGRFVLIFNGEIYNHLELRRELEQAGKTLAWHGRSDTETLLAGFDAWGVRRTIERCIGMFALAVWDRHEYVLTLARDRLGEKPLYYGWQGMGEQACFLFASELKALKAYPLFGAEIDRNALCLFMRHNYIPAPYSIYRGIYKLPPGHLLTLTTSQREPALEAYWFLPDVAVRGKQSQLKNIGQDIVDELELLLKSAVNQQMVADVPLGAFLSGGIDSSTVVALMQAQSVMPVKTFTIGFNEESYNEAVYAKAVARHLGTDHTELYVTPKQALDVIPRLPELYDEPFADSSQVPTFLVAQLARQHVTVALSGDGGDELFGGYTRYARARSIWRKLSSLPLWTRVLASHSIQMVSPRRWNQLAFPLRALLPPAWQFAELGDKLQKGARILTAQRIDEVYLSLVTHWEPERIVLDGREPATYINGAPPEFDGLDEVERIMALDAMTYLPDDILVKVDRAAMGVSLETRMPLLDHRVVEFVWRIPSFMKVKGGVGKQILRQVLYRYVPRELIERPKMGFGVPIDGWLCGPLREWAEELLNERRLQREGFFNPRPVRTRWAEHLSGRRDWQYLLWGVLMFQAWLENQSSVV